jgi:predicted O-methyltransferase YrrM
MMNINDTNVRGALCSSASRIELWQHVIGHIQAKAMLEIGVWKGDFAEQMLRSCDSIERYYMIDPWANLPDWNKPFNVAPEVFDEIYQEAITKTQFAAPKIVTLRGRTKDVINEIPDDSLDFAYIDGDHTLRGITIDLMKVLPKIKEGGIIGGDDFTHSPWQHDIRYEPTLVCPYSIYFAEAVDLPIVALPHNQFLIQKNSKAKFSFLDTTGSYKDISLNKLPTIDHVQGNSVPQEETTSSWLHRNLDGLRRFLRGSGA